MKNYIYYCGMQFSLSEEILQFFSNEIRNKRLLTFISFKLVIPLKLTIEKRTGSIAVTVIQFQFDYSCTEWIASSVEISDSQFPR